MTSARLVNIEATGHRRKSHFEQIRSALPQITDIDSSPLVASDADWAQLDSDFKAGKEALGSEDWIGATAALELAALRDPLNVQNYIGYAYRRLRQLAPAIDHHQQALMPNPRHPSAREHLGEAYLVLGEPAKAEQLLAALENLCLIPCEEYDDLKRAIATYKRLSTR
jgi:Flp pilus assembly protein TadD